MASTPASPRGLVDRIGGPERLLELLDEFYERLAADVLVGFFFVGKDLGAIARGQRDFLMWATGAVTEKPAKHPITAHDELPPILAGHFDRRLRVLEEVLRKEGVAEEDIDAWRRLDDSFRGRLQGSHPPG